MDALSDRELLARLVAFDSTSARSNLPVADFAREYVEGPGVSVVELPAGAPDKVNLLARCGPEESPGGLTLCGHVDVVPADPAGWTSDPWTLTERGSAWFARGACDMKGSVALALNLLRETAARGPAAPLCVLLSADEELGSLGARALARAWGDAPPVPRAVVVGEPTSLRAVRLHKGHCSVRIAFAGRSAHSGYPNLGVNAIEPAGVAVVALAELRRQLAGEPAANAEFFPEAPFTVLNVGRIEGGSAVNVVPADCTIDVGVRPLPGQSAAPIVERLARAVADAAGGDATVEVINDNPPLETPADAPIHRRLCAPLDQSASFGVPFASDAGHLSATGLDCVLFGPGDISVAHRPDEHVPIAEMESARRVLERLVAESCF